MPFYEYECASCKFYTEVMQKITDAPLTKCPSCGKKALQKLVSAPNFRLKGGGWYETDFKGDQEKRRNLAGAEKDEAVKADAKAEPAKADKADAAGATAKDTAKADTKADTKPPVSEKSAGRKPAGRGARTKPVRAAAKQARSAKAKSAARGRTRR